MWGMGSEDGVWVEFHSTPFVFLTDAFTGNLLCLWNLRGVIFFATKSLFSDAPLLPDDAAIFHHINQLCHHMHQVLEQQVRQ